MARSDEQTNLRIPSELKAWLQKQAEASRRSLTAEVVLRLEQTRTQQSTTPKGTP